MRSSSPAFSSDSYSPAASTAPSTPPSELAGSYFLVLHDATPAFLDALPAGKASHDRILLCRGTGPVKPLLNAAADLLGEKTILDDARWERVTAKDNDGEVVYFKSKESISAVDEKPAVMLDAIACESKPVSTLPLELHTTADPCFCRHPMPRC